MFALGLGLFISTLARNQFVAGQLSFLTTMMPAMMLSGMLFDITAMPRWLQIVTYFVPARYLVSILQTLFLAGDADGDVQFVIVAAAEGARAATAINRELQDEDRGEPRCVEAAGTGHRSRAST